MASLERNSLYRGDGYYEVDFGGHRFTHYPSGDTLLKHRYMLGSKSGRQKWMDEREAFFAKHPQTNLLVVLRIAGQVEVIGDVRDMALRAEPFGRTFEVGDQVVTMTGADRDADCVREIVAVRPNGDPKFHEPGDAAQSYLLEDGTVLYWDSGCDGWWAKTRDGSDRSRARRPVDGELTPDLVMGSGEILKKAIPGIIHVLADVRDSHWLWSDPWATASGITADAVQAVVSARSEGRQALCDDLEAPAHVAAAATALAQAEALIERALAAEGADVLHRCRGPHAPYESVRGIQDPVQAVALTMRHRGVLPEVAPAPVGPR